MLKLRSGIGVVLSIAILFVVGFIFWLQRPASALDAYLAETPPPFPDDLYYGDEIIPPIPSPDFDLLNYTGERISNEDLEGRVVLLSFAYTSCPDTCPVLFGKFLNIQNELAELIGEQVELAFISVDPEVDTPERLSDHVEAIDGSWYFLTEDLSVMQDVWDDFGVFVEKDPPLVSHTNLTYLIDKQGLVRVEYTGLPPVDVFLADIQRILAEN